MFTEEVMVVSFNHVIFSQNCRLLSSRDVLPWEAATGDKMKHYLALNKMSFIIIGKILHNAKSTIPQKNNNNSYINDNKCLFQYLHYLCYST